MSGENDLGTIVNDMKERFVPQYRFARRLKRKFKSDYACPDFGILLEYDGLVIYDPETGEENKGGHMTLKGVKNDTDKINTATLMGFYTLRYNRDTICIDTVEANIRQLIHRRKEEVNHREVCCMCDNHIWLPLPMVPDLGNGSYVCLFCQWELDDKEDELKRSKRNKINVTKP